MEVNEIYETYKLPEIKREGLTEVEYEHRCKYLRLYIKIIERCKNMTEEELSVPCEVHHILPRTFGGNNDKANLVKMPVRYHVFSHIVLIIVYPKSYKLFFALNFIINGKKEYNKSDIKIRVEESLKHLSSRTISFLREERLKVLKSDEYRQSISGPNNPLYRRPVSEETRKKLSIAGKGKKRSKEFVENLRRVNLGRHHTEETKKKLSEIRKKLPPTRTGAVLSDETKKKISEHHADVSGKNNPAARKVISPTGVIYDTIKEACEQNNYSRGKLTNLLKKEDSNWNYYNENKD